MLSEHSRRSCLYVPGINAKAITKARALPADVIIFDLEDSIAPDAKADARKAVCDAIAAGGFGDREIVVRINAADTPWHADDLAMTCTSRAAAALVPKICSAEDVRRISSAMSGTAALWVMIEMPAAVLNLAAIAGCASDQRLAAMVLGFNDLAKEMGTVPAKDRSIFAPILLQTALAARANKIAAIDSVFNDFSDADGLAAECAEARRYGFDGKSVIHPAQIDTANAIFAPSAEEIEEARAIVAAYAEPANQTAGVIRIDGKMVERLHLAMAETILARAARIASTNG